MAVEELYVCPKCGNVFLSDNKFPICSECECVEIIEIDDNTYNEISKSVKIEDDDIIACIKMKHELIREKYVYNNPAFDKVAYHHRIQHELDAIAERHAPHCPRCGSGDFEMVARKWSPLTGFLTNKVDRVCKKCGKRF